MSTATVDTASTARAGLLPEPVLRTLDRVRAVQPEEADGAGHALAAALDGVRRSPWQEVAWRSSVLTGTGLPVELAWASRDAVLRWTSEAAGPEVPEPERLGLCGSAAGRLAGSSVDLGPWSAVQRGRPLRWGAWLGLRHDGAARRGKVYAELPDGLPPGPWSAVGRTVSRTVPGLVWRMAGCNDDGSVELYARVPALTPDALAATTTLVGDRYALAALVGVLTAQRGPVGDHRLPRPSGLSVVLAPDGTAEAVTWFAFAKSMWSSDAATAAAVLRVCAPEAGLVEAGAPSLALYASLAAGPEDGRWRHGMVGVGVDRDGGRWLQAGVRPT